MIKTAALLALLLFTSSPAFSQNKAAEIRVPANYSPIDPQTSTMLQAIVDGSVRSVIQEKPIAPEKLGVTLIDLRDAGHPISADFRGGERFFPASVVKLFYLAAVERQLEDKQVSDSPELERGIHDMIVSSSNDATQYVFDVITGTSGGSELPQNKFAAWQSRRDVVNRWFSRLGYANINVNQKTFCEDAYGLELQSRKYKGGNYNALTTNAVARLMTEIVLGRINTADRTAAMTKLLEREWAKPSADTEDQATGFIGRALIERKLTGTRLWSKAGWTSTVRHDAAYVETPDGLKFVLVVFTGYPNDRDIIPAIAGKVLDALERKQ